MQTASYAICRIRLLGETIYGNDDATQSALDEGFCCGAAERLGIGGDDGVESHLMGCGYHLGQLLIEQGFALKIELHGMGVFLDIVKDTMEEFHR